MHTLAAFVVEGTTILNQSLQSMEDITESSVAKEKISERMQTVFWNKTPFLKFKTNKHCEYASCQRNVLFP